MQPNSLSVGLIGLGTMGGNLARNLARHGYTVAIFNRTHSKTVNFLRRYGQEGNFIGCASLGELVQHLPRPRRILLLVSAGAAVDAALDTLLPLLSPSDTVADCGNSFFKDTIRRQVAAVEYQVNYAGVGVSGGAAGALNGPSLMVGAAPEVYPRLQDLLETIAAPSLAGPCCALLGSCGAGHFVKMVHNAIEYAEMQLIAEIYDLLRNVLQQSSRDCSKFFKSANRTELGGYLTEITAQILQKTDTATGVAAIDLIDDRADANGTGQWASATALELQIAAPCLTDSVYWRYLSNDLTTRKLVQNHYVPKRLGFELSHRKFLSALRQFWWCGKMVIYHQGFALIAQAAKVYDWPVELAQICRIWQNGCIIRGNHLPMLSQILQSTPAPTNVLTAPEILQQFSSKSGAWRNVLAAGILQGINLPLSSAALAYFDALCAAELPTSLIQAQRDFFGQHKVRRRDRPGELPAHYLWQKDEK